MRLPSLFTEAKWQNERNIHNTQGGFLIPNIIIQFAYESSLLYVLGLPGYTSLVITKSRKIIVPLDNQKYMYNV